MRTAADKKICRAGASCRQLWVTACAQGCRKRGRGEGGTLRFPDFSQPSPLSGFHCTAACERRRRRHAPCVPQSRIRFTQLASSQTRTDHRRGEYSNTERVCGRGGVFFFTRTWSAGQPRAPPQFAAAASSLLQAGLGSVVYRRRRPRPVSRPGSSVWGTHKEAQTLGSGAV